MAKIALDLSGKCRTFVTCNSISDLTDWGWQLEMSSPSTSARFLRAHKMGTFKQLFDEFAAGLQFPYYFGENWNAFRDCLSDLDWLPGTRHVIVIWNSNQLLKDDSFEQTEALFEYLSLAIEELRQQGKNLSIVFQENEDAAQTINYLRALNVDFEIIG